jgi:hypothetical protein
MEMIGNGKTAQFFVRYLLLFIFAGCGKNETSALSPGVRSTATAHHGSHLLLPENRSWTFIQMIPPTTGAIHWGPV